MRSTARIMVVLFAGVALGQVLADDKIKTLTVEQATTLVTQHRGSSLLLNGLTTLDAATAKTLAELKGAALFLKGLTTLSDEAAAALRANPKIVLPDKFKRATAGQEQPRAGD